ncbi:hypothetical protein PJL15_04388 [Paenarthrobacter nitroguajacolicus]|nr:hypothetical protein [Paenarthrobacter nitroguajacolicus]
MREVEDPDHDHRGSHQSQQQRWLALHQAGQDEADQHEIGSHQAQERTEAAPTRYRDHHNGVQNRQGSDGDVADEINEDIRRSPASGVAALDAGEIQVPDGVAHIHAMGHGNVRVNDHLDRFPALVRHCEGKGALRAAGLVLAGLVLAGLVLA